MDDGLPTTHSPKTRARDGMRRVVAGIAPVLALYLVYTLIRFLVAGRGPAVGEAHALRLLDLERALGLDVELRLQQAALGYDWLVKAANLYYVYGFLPVIVLCAALGAWRASRAFAWWRTVFAFSLGIALVGYAAIPLAPPRLLPPEFGYVDTLQVYGPRYYGDATGASLFNGYGSIPNLFNEYAAMPSMHVAWSVIAVCLLCAAFRFRWWAVLLAILHPALMTLAVIVTGNHFLLDIAGGFAVLAIAVGFATQLWHLPAEALPRRASLSV